MNSDDYRTSHLGKGDDYHRMFSEDPRRAMMWRLEQAEILRLVNERFPDRIPSHLDFACGTGRVLRLLSHRCSDSVGIDVSESMLEVARREVPDARLECADITREQVLSDAKFDLITAFRFFPNAQPELRREVIIQLKNRMSPGGLLVFNNHMNGNSFHTLALRLSGRDPGHTMSMAEVRDLVALGGLRIDSQVNLGVIPYYAPVFRRTARSYESLERRMASNRLLAGKAENVIVAARSL